MSAPNDGGPAFPSQELNNDRSPYYLNQGMSLRAYIAVHRPLPDEYTADFGAILVGRNPPKIIEYGNSEGSTQAYWKDCQKWWAEVGAAYSVMQADALLAELGKVRP